MSKYKPLLPVLTVFILMMFAGGIYHLLALRHRRGDIYPAYSSLRGDPLGVKALYESLGYAGKTVRRNYAPLSSARAFHEGEVLLYLGATGHEDPFFNEKTVESVMRRVQSGGTFIVAFFPRTGPAQIMNGADTNDDPPQNSSDVKADEEAARPAFTFSDRTGVSIQNHRKPGRMTTAQRTASAGPDSEATIPWRTGRHFTNLDPEWNILYTVSRHPVIIEKEADRGRIVLCADSYFFSNEALSLHRSPGLIARLIGGGKTVVFDEAHLGVTRDANIAGLIVKYRFHGFFAGLIAIGCLFIWMQTAAFLPPPANRGPAAGAVASKRDNTQALFTLLKRNIPAHRLMTACVDEWEKTFLIKKNPFIKRHRRLRLQAARRAISAAGAKDPVAVYHQVRQILYSNTPLKEKNQ